MTKQSVFLKKMTKPNIFTNKKKNKIRKQKEEKFQPPEFFFLVFLLKVRKWCFPPAQIFLSKNMTKQCISLKRYDNKTKQNIWNDNLVQNPLSSASIFQKKALRRVLSKPVSCREAYHFSVTIE